MEPPAAVPLNNGLAAARGEMYAAEEAVLWVLTGRVADVRHAVEASLDAVVWLDGVAARARYGRWIGGVLPQLSDFPKTGKARGGSIKRGGDEAATAEAEADAAAQDESQRHWVYLRRLRCALSACL